MATLSFKKTPIPPGSFFKTLKDFLLPQAVKTIDTISHVLRLWLSMYRDCPRQIRAGVIHILLAIFDQLFGGITSRAKLFMALHLRRSTMVHYVKNSNLEARLHWSLVSRYLESMARIFTIRPGSVAGTASLFEVLKTSCSRS